MTSMFRLTVFCLLLIGNGSTLIVPELDSGILGTVCYDDLGCFPTGGIFFDLILRPISLPPQSPEWIGTTFTLYTRESIPEKIIDGPDLKCNAFDPKKDTKIIVHGFTESINAPWMTTMAYRFLILDDLNVILVDWRRGALTAYEQATANTRVVGAQIAQLITSLKTVKGADFAKFHIIGHSLGAQICGYAGERINGLGRISGLDAAGPYFEGMDTAVRLDPTDALFVDVIHTDMTAGDSIITRLSGLSTPIQIGGGADQIAGIGLGIKEPSGHVDFYPNGGSVQPGCSKIEVLVDTITELSVDGIIKDAKLVLACDHLRAYELYISSITEQAPCFNAYPCPCYKDFSACKCDDCGATGCGIMGYYADKAKPKTDGIFNTYNLKTNAEEPFCYDHQAPCGGRQYNISSVGSSTEI